MNYEPVIGLEVHVQLDTASKLFCACSADHFGKEANTQVCPICLGLPGALPSPPNDKAIKKVVLIAKALRCQLAKECCFERKCYFYPDLPKGFQISQHRTAIGENGQFSGHGGQGGVRIRRVHLEEDAAKLIHKKGYTLIDFNRAGVSLVEIVTEPEVESISRAKDFLKGLQILVRHLGVSDADMEKGSMRLEANISLREEGSKGLPGYRVELKNINSFSFLAKALREEIERQEKILRSGGKVAQETRGYDEKAGKTYSQRQKEDASDYRYFPEPDLPPLTAAILTCDEEVKLPGDLQEQFEKEYHLPRRYAEILAADPELTVLFEELVAKGVGYGEAANIIVNHRFGDPRSLGAKRIVEAVRESRKKTSVREGEIEDAIDRIMKENPQAISDYRGGKEPALQFLLGRLMRETGGRVDPEVGKRAIREKIAADS